MDTFLGSLVLLHRGARGTLQTNDTGVCSQCLSHTWPAPTHGAYTLPAHTVQALGCSTGDSLRPGLGCLHLPGLSRSGSGTRVVLRGADSVGSVFCALLRAAQVMRCLESTVAATYRLLYPCRLVFWVYNQRTFSGGC